MSTESEGIDASRVVTDLVHQAAHIPIPPVVRRSLFQAINALITGLADVPAAWLEGRAQAIRDETTARSRVIEAAGYQAADRFSDDPELVERATRFLGARLIREQKNRETIAKHAVEAAASDPPTQDTTTTIDDDWLDMFARIAETKSQGEMQVYLGKLLAGEIRKPGSFSPATVEVLSKLTPRLAKSFQAFCSISMELPIDDEAFVLAEPYGYPGQNDLASLGFDYRSLAELQNVGLVHTELETWFKMTDGELSSVKLRIAGRVYSIRGTVKAPGKVRELKNINFTQAGQELRRIVHMESNSEYLHRLKKWLKTVAGLELCEET